MGKGEFDPLFEEGMHKGSCFYPPCIGWVELSPMLEGGVLLEVKQPQSGKRAYDGVALPKVVKEPGCLDGYFE